MRKLALDRRGIPTGEEQAFGGFDAPLGALHLDDGLAVLQQPACLTLEAGGLRIAVELLAGYAYAQVFAPKDGGYVALEPMTAPTNALVSGDGLQVVEPGGTYRAAFRIRVIALPRFS
jgi:aldose 1-epimerase